MFTFEAQDGTRFHYNANFVGEVLVEGRRGVSSLPGAAILELVARCYVAPGRLKILEDLGTDTDSAVSELANADVTSLLLKTI